MDPPPTCESTVSSLSDTAVEGLPQARDLSVALDAAAGLRLVCTRVDRPEEQHLVEREAVALQHDLLLAGLLADTSYDCVATPLCEGGLDGASSGHLLTTDTQDEPLPELTLEGTPDGPYLLLNHAQVCSRAMPNRLLLYDAEGRLRWSYGGIPDGVALGLGVDYLGAGVFLWGGGDSTEGAATLVDLRGEVVYRSAFEGSDGLRFHHEARQLSDGSLLTLAEAPNHDADTQWTGFVLHVHDPETGQLTWTWNSQQGVDAGRLEPGHGDAYHANWADVDLDARRATIALCKPRQLIAVDIDTDEVAWVAGPQGDLALVDDAGAPLDEDDWPQCQHGLEILGGQVLTFDNGVDREQSRLSIFAIDTAAGTYTRTWSWTEDGFWEAALGDVDHLPDGRILAARGHVPCIEGNEAGYSEILAVDPARGVVDWRVRFGDEQDSVYRVERVDACDVLPNSLACPEVAARLAALASR